MAVAPALIDVGLLLLILLAFLLLAILIIIGNNAPTFPFGIGNVVKDYVTDPLANLLRYFVHLLLQSLVDFTTAAVFDTAAGLIIAGNSFTQTVNYFFDTMVQVEHFTFAPAILSLVNWAYGGNIVADIQYGVQVASNSAARIDYLSGILVNLAGRVVNLENQVFTLASEVGQVSLGQLLQTTQIAIQAEQDAKTALAEIDNIGKTVLFPLATTINTVAHQVDINTLGISILTNEVGPIITSFPLLRDEVGAIVTDIPLIGSAVGRLEGEITTVLPLAAIAVLGAEAVNTLVNVAEDPCYCFNVGGNMEWMKIAIVDQMMLNGI